MKKTLFVGLTLLASLSACKNDSPKNDIPANTPPPTENNTQVPVLNTSKIDLGKVQQGVATGNEIKNELNQLSAEINQLPAAAKKQHKAEVDEARETINAMLEKSSLLLNEIRVVEVLKKQANAGDPATRQTSGLQQQQNLPADAANPEEASLIKGVQESKQAIYLLDENIKSLNELKPVIEELKAKVAKLKQ